LLNPSKLESINLSVVQPPKLFLIMEPLPPELKPLGAKLESASTLIKRFSAGVAIGLVIAAMYWGTTYFFGYPLPLIRGITGCVALALICGLMTLRWGYKTLETLWENLLLQ
jgi:hypothetical protein